MIAPGAHAASSRLGPDARCVQEVGLAPELLGFRVWEDLIPRPRGIGSWEGRVQAAASPNAQLCAAYANRALSVRTVSTPAGVSLNLSHVPPTR